MPRGAVGCKKVESESKVVTTSTLVGVFAQHRTTVTVTDHLKICKYRQVSCKIVPISHIREK
jgi:hypothetical protein